MTLSIDALNWRASVKQFDAEKKLTQAQVDTLLEALRLTASSFGLQPWKFLLIETASLRQKLQEVSWNQTQITEASHLIVLARPEDITEKDVTAYIEDMAQKRHQNPEDLAAYKGMMLGFINAKSKEARQIWMEKQVYIALGNLLTVCALEKIDACPMEGLDAAAYDDILGLNSKGLHTVVACPVGYRHTSDVYSQREKVRFSKEQIITVL